MYKCIATGENENYGKKGETVFINNNHAQVGVNQGWLEKKIVFVGTYKPYTKYYCETIIKNINMHIKKLELQRQFYEERLKEMNVKFKGV